MEQKKIVSWDISQGEPPVNAHAVLDEYNIMIEKGIIKEHYINKLCAEEKNEDGTRQMIWSETKVEVLMPMYNFPSIEPPYFYRERTTTHFGTSATLRSDDQTRINIGPKIVQLIAHSCMIKFIKDRDENTRDDNHPARLPA